MNILKLILLVLTASLYATSIPFSGDSVVPQDKSYFKHQLQNQDIELIYTHDNIFFAKQSAEIETPLNRDYENYFDWKLDETLYVGLISDNNQVANGFSTQFPNNRQINYVGGALNVDYFCSKSWLNTLLYHETAHNYQANVKGSLVSQSFHFLFGNGAFLLPSFVTIPNSLLNPFVLEGNAVLNESWHGNGGRLYSGRFAAQTALQAKAGKITPANMYNSRVEFPYGESYYIQGGFYNLYLAQNYGLKKTNSFFKNNSTYWFWPFFTNDAMYESIGVNFEESLASFAKEQKTIASKMKAASGETIASSQYFYPLSNSKESIFFLTNESAKRAPELLVLDKKSQELTKRRESWLSGKVIKVDDEYYTQGSAKTSPMKISQGLFSSGGFIKEGSDSKVIQAYLSDNRAVYFDVASSYSEPHLYVGDSFYGVVNSSVIVDAKDNLYYFKQEGKRRTLYKNRTPLFSYQGFYGVVSDVDSKGAIYFVANSFYGATLYRYKNHTLSRASSADNIVEARLVNDKEVLLAAISDKDYYYVITDISEVQGKPYDVKHFFEEKPYYGEYTKSAAVEELDLNSSYNSFLEMHYSGTDASLGYSTTAGVVGDLTFNFADPLTQNAANVFVSRDESNISLAGIGYSSSLYLLEYGFSLYGVIDNAQKEDTRSSGVTASASLPLYESAYYKIALNAYYYQDYDALSRKPMSTTVHLSHYEQYGISMYANAANSLELYGVSERGDKIFGGSYSFTHDLYEDLYAGFQLKYSETDAKSGEGERGVKVSNLSFFQDMDPSAITMASIASTGYVKRASYAEINLAKVFNFSAYFFTFPLSLQRESLYIRYRYYDILAFDKTKYNTGETTVGGVLSTVVLNSFEFPLTLEYLHNKADFILEENSYRFLFGYNF